LAIVDVRVVRESPRAARLVVTDRMPRYTLVATDGSVVVGRPSRGIRRWRIDVVAVRGGWRIARVATAQ
jgi:hypothetical protein